MSSGKSISKIQILTTDVVNWHWVGAGFLNSATIPKAAYNIDDLAKGIPGVLENGSRHQKKLS